MSEQLLLFEECIQEKHERKLERLKESQDMLRKSLHAKNNGLDKRVRDLESEVEFLKAHICKGILLL